MPTIADFVIINDKKFTIPIEGPTYLNTSSIKNFNLNPGARLGHRSILTFMVSRDSGGPDPKLEITMNAPEGHPSEPTFRQTFTISALHDTTLQEVIRINSLVAGTNEIIFTHVASAGDDLEAGNAKIHIKDVVLHYQRDI